MFEGVSLPESSRVVEETSSKGGTSFVIAMDEPLTRGDGLGIGLEWDPDTREYECLEGVEDCLTTYLGSVRVPSPRTEGDTCSLTAHEERTEGDEGAVLKLNIYCGYP